MGTQPGLPMTPDTEPGVRSLARYALMADGEQIHSAMYPGSFAGDRFSPQVEANHRPASARTGH